MDYIIYEKDTGNPFPFYSCTSRINFHSFFSFHFFGLFIEKNKFDRLQRKRNTKRQLGTFNF